MCLTSYFAHVHFLLMSFVSTFHHHGDRFQKSRSSGRLHNGIQNEPFTVELSEGTRESIFLAILCYIVYVEDIDEISGDGRTSGDINVKFPFTHTSNQVKTKNRLHSCETEISTCALPLYTTVPATHLQKQNRMHSTHFEHNYVSTARVVAQELYNSARLQ